MQTSTALKTVQMTTAEWAAVPDSPRQRDTAAHSRKALKGHLKAASPTHARVSAASINGRVVCKLDGHTRSHLWQSGKLEKPAHGKVSVDVYPVSNMEEANALYVQFDNSQAVEDSHDKIAGAFREHGIALTSPLLDTTSHANTLRFVEYGEGSRRFVDLYKIVGNWKEELLILDSWGLHKKVPASVVAVFLMLVRAEEANILLVRAFTEAVCGGGGIKGSSGSDGVCWLVDTIALMRAAGRLSGTRNSMTLSQYTYACWKRYKRGHIVARKPVEADLGPLFEACGTGRFLPEAVGT